MRCFNGHGIEPNPGPMQSGLEGRAEDAAPDDLEIDAFTIELEAKLEAIAQGCPRYHRSNRSNEATTGEGHLTREAYRRCVEADIEDKFRAKRIELEGFRTNRTGRRAYSRAYWNLA